MAKIIAAINTTIDGYCDHTVMIADDEIHQHYNELLRSGGGLIYGRITYQLMEGFWPTIVKNPSGNQPVDEFAVLIDAIPKIVFSRTLKSVDWNNARLASRSLEEEILELKKFPGKDISVGSRSLIVELLNLKLIDELQLCIQPILVGRGLPLFEGIDGRITFELRKTKTFRNGAIIQYYLPNS